MEQRIKNMFHRRFAVIWIAATVLFIGFGTQLGADEHAAADDKRLGANQRSLRGRDSRSSMRHLKACFLLEQEGGGIFRSTDRGDTWTPVNTGLRFEPGKHLSGLLQPSRRKEMCFMLARGTVCMHQAMLAPHGTTF